MKKVYSEKEFQDMQVTCPNCSWEGKGLNVIIIDLYGVSKLKEAHCPNCDAYLAGISNSIEPETGSNELSMQFG